MNRAAIVAALALSTALAPPRVIAQATPTKGSQDFLERFTRLVAATAFAEDGRLAAMPESTFQAVFQGRRLQAAPRLPPVYMTNAPLGAATDTAEIRKSLARIKIREDSLFKEACRNGTVSASGGCSGSAGTPRVTYIRRHTQAVRAERMRIDSILRAMLPPVVTPEPNKKPVPLFTVSYSGNLITLDGRSSTDDKGIVSYTFRSAGTDRPDKPGPVTTRAWEGTPWPEWLIVRDSAGLVDSTFRQILGPPVPVPPPPPPVDTTTPTPVPPPPPPPSGSRAPELPRTTLAFTYPSVTRTVTVPAGGNLQAALNASLPFDEIVCQAGATYTANFSLPNRSNGWVVVRSNQSHLLPPMGTRVDPSHSPLMCRIVTDNTAPAMKTIGFTNGWWFTGVEFTVSPSVTAQNYGIVTLGALGAQQTSLAQVPTNFVLDRVIVRGAPNTNLSRCVALNSGRTQISDSYLTECHGKDFDSQAVWGANGPGPYKIVNNYLAGAGENIMFGGGDPDIPGLVPSDIEIRGNYIHTPLSWRGVWQKKNLLELKNASRLLIEGNVFENSWADGQTGWAVIFKSANQGGDCRWCRTTDVTFRRNLVVNAGAGINVAGIVNSDSLTRRILISETIVDSINFTLPGDRRGFQILGDTRDVTIDRTVLTISRNESTALWLEQLSGGCVFSNNVWDLGKYGVLASGASGGTPSLDKGCGVGGWTLTNHLWSTAAGAATAAAGIRAVVQQATAGVRK